MPGLDEKKLKELFDSHFDELYLYALRFVREENLASDIVQEAYIGLWEKRKGIREDRSYRSYLYTAVRNRSLNELRSSWLQIQKGEESDAWMAAVAEPFQGDKMELKDLEDILDRALSVLPSRCYTIFVMSRFGGYSRAEIAAGLGVSVKTVENQITIALRKIREYLNHYGALSLLLTGLLSLPVS